MIQFNKLLLITLSFILFTASNSVAQILAQWNFDVNSTATTLPANATVSAATWSVGTVTFPNGHTTATTDNSISTTGFNVAAINTAKYLQFSIAPNANYAMVLNNVSFFDQKSGTGPTTWILRSSLDNYMENLNTVTTTNTPFSATPNLVELGIKFQNINTPVTFRVYAYGASSSAGAWRIDDLTIEGSLFDVSNPIINASKTAISFSTIQVGAPSVASSFIAAGFGLTSDLVVTAPTGYEISNSLSSGYTSSLVFPQTGGVVTSKLIYVRLTGVTAGFYSANLTITSTGLASKSIALTGNTIIQPTRTSIASVRSRSNNTNVFTGGRVTVATEFAPSQIFIQDNSGGISVYNGAKNIAVEYGLQLGDSVEIFGYKSNFNSLDQITLLALTKIGTPQYNPPPIVINASEMAAHEGELVTIQNVSFPGTGGNYVANTNYGFGFVPIRILSTNGSNTIVGSAIQAATGNITGISGVYGTGVQLYPRFIADLNPTGAGISDATFRDNNALNIVSWNVNWFGSPTQGPSNLTTQYNNVKTVLTTINADIFEMEEVSDSVSFQALVASIGGYTCKCSPEYSYSNSAPVDPYGQRLCFVYKNSVFSNVTTTPLLTNYKNDPSLLVGYPNSNSRFWASGRLPFMMTANVTINGVTRNMGFVAVHARANTSASPAQDIYDMRKYDVEKLKEYLDANYPNLPLIMSGDFNDDLDETVAYVATNTSTYSSFINDASNYDLFSLNLSKAGARSTVGFTDVIDHIIGSNEMSSTFITARVGTPQTYIASYGTTTTDHYPVMAKFNLGSLPVPVELLSFSGQLIDKQTVRLDWATSSEINSNYFSIERSTDGKDFKAIEQVKAAGNSNQKINYTFDDNSFLATNNVVYYRLKQVDFNGAFKYSKTVAIYTEITKNTPIKVYPNPAKNTISVDNSASIKSINIYNLQGVLMAKSLINNVDISTFSAGIYLLEVENTEGSLSRIKFVKE
jgi:Secretion system C-terminal sorting domain/Endonuclease/Exonuclease/phosphatase family/Family of unknown function (DUF5689)